VPTLSDWADHLTTLFPEARIKKFIEMRGADGGPWRRLCALPAFWVGLTYDQGALDAAWDLVKGWDAETRDALRVAAVGPRAGCQGGRIDMHELAREVLAIAEAGSTRGRAKARAAHPRRDAFPAALKESVESGQGARRRVAGALPTATGTAI
jgi:glutamate--cysteine ligase